MKVFEAALAVIQTHRTYSAINSATNTAHYACSGCAWSDSRAGSNDEHLAAEIDKLVGSKRTTPEIRRYLTRAGRPVQVILLPGGAATVTWQQENGDAGFTSNETERWVDDEVQAGWLLPIPERS